MLDTIFYYTGGVIFILILILTGGRLLHFLHYTLFPMLCRESKEYQIGLNYFNIIGRKKKLPGFQNKQLSFLNKLQKLIEEYGLQE